MLAPNSICPLCKKEFRAGDAVIRFERIYRVGKVHTEATELGEFAHLRCP